MRSFFKDLSMEMMRHSLLFIISMSIFFCNMAEVWDLINEVLKDAIQDVFVKLYLNRRSLSEVRNLKYYLFRSLKNNLLDMFESIGRYL